MDKNWQQYKSGTDIRFTAVSTETNIADMDADTIAAIVKAFAFWLSERTGKKLLTVAVGHDCRISADWIASSAKNALSAVGCLVYDCGLCSTPSMFGMTQYDETKADGSIMITASHHPFDKNGLKFFTADGGVEGTDITQILTFASKAVSLANADGKTVAADYMSLYVRSLLSRIRAATGEEQPLKGSHLVVDAGNGAGGFFTERVLVPLGADVSGSQFLEPDGRFPNHIPNPENKAAMRAISDCVLKNKADLGIIFDTDVDRAAIVASDGREINRNRLIALISAVVLKESAGATIVTDSVTSDGLAAFIRDCGGIHRRFKRGYKNVIDEARRLEAEGINAPLAIETSGHAALKENHFLDDGAYLVVKILMTMCVLRREGKNLLALIDGLAEPAEDEEIRLGYRVQDWKRVGQAVLMDLEIKAAKVAEWRVATDSCEGVRVSTPQGFFLMRMSVHDPVLPVNFESNEKGGVKLMEQALYDMLKDEKSLDCSALADVLKNSERK